MPYKNKEDQATCAKKHYQANKIVYKARARKKTAEVIIRNKTLILEYLLSNPCIDCGEEDPIVLEFDHVRGLKRGNIADGKNSWSIKTLQKEIDKCEVRCANCHRKVTHKRRLRDV